MDLEIRTARCAPCAAEYQSRKRGSFYVMNMEQFTETRELRRAAAEASGLRPDEKSCVDCGLPVNTP
jgi:hypothetical protein